MGEMLGAEVEASGAMLPSSDAFSLFTIALVLGGILICTVQCSSH